MALEPQNVPIILAQGIDTKTDPKQVIVGKLLTLQNASFESPKEIKKRDGFGKLSNEVLGHPTTVSTGVGIAGYKDELTVLDGTFLYSYSPDAGKQVPKGALTPINLSISAVARNTSQLSCADSAYRSDTGIQIFTWLTESAGINYSIFDTTTGATIVTNGVVSATATKAKVLKLGNLFFIVYYEPGTPGLFYRTVDKNTPNAIGSPNLIANDIASASPVFDCTIIGTSCYIAYAISTNQIGFYSFSSSLVPSSQYVVTTGHQPNPCLAIFGDASNRVWVSYASKSGGAYTIYAIIVNTALNSTVLTNTLVYGPLASQSVKNISMIVATNTATIIWQDLAGLGQNTLTSAGVAGTASFFLYSFGLASKIFTHGSINYFIGLFGGNQFSNVDNTIATAQPTYFLFDTSGDVYLKLAPSIAGPLYTSGLLPEVTSFTSTKYTIPYLIQDNLSALAGNVFYKTGVMSSSIDFNLPYAPPKLVLGNDLHLASGQLWMYDGANVVEHGFHIYPDNLGYSLVASGGGIGSSLNSGPINQIQYAALYEWSDNQGQLHRSPASPVITIRLPPASSLSAVTFTSNSVANSNVLSSVSSFSGLFVGQVLADDTNASNLTSGTYIFRLDSTNSLIYLSQPATASHSGDTYSTKDVCAITVNIPTLQATRKTGVSIALYRTENNQTVFYRVSSLTSLTYNDKSLSYMQIVDRMPDSAIIGNEELYTTGGEVDNYAAPAVSALTTFKNRAIYLSPENPFQWGYSKQVIDGSPVEFSSLLFFQNVDQRVGKLCAAGPLDDKLVLFGPTSKYYVVGTGPSPSGANNDFSEATKIAGTTGCSNPASVLEIPIGLMYQDGVKGIWILDRSLQERYIGAEVEEFNSYTVTSAQHVPDANKAIFTLSNGSNLVYDYFVNQWEVDPFPQPVVDATVFQNDYCYVQADGLELQQTPGSFIDTQNATLSAVLMSLKTGWLSFAQIQGFQRVWELQILGEYKSEHTLTVNIYVDFKDTIAQTFTIPVLTDPGLYQFRLTMKRQKCEAMQIEIIESQSSLGEGFSLSALTLRCGIKKGLNKLPASRSY